MRGGSWTRLSFSFAAFPSGRFAVVSFVGFPLQRLRHQLRNVLAREFFVHAERFRAVVQH
jgi:hypothetical protein